MSRYENLTIMLTDIVGFTERMAKTSREDMRRLLRTHNRIIRSNIKYHGGKYIKSTGDGALASFRGTTNAAQCAMAIQDSLAEYNQGREENEQLRVRIAIHLGEVRREERGDVTGDAVNITARVESITPADEIYLTGSAYMSVNKAEVPTEHVGAQKLKGIEGSIQLFSIPRGQKTRLVATGEPLEEGGGLNLPYGGVPRPKTFTILDGWISPTQRPLLIAAAAFLGTAIFLISLAFGMGWLSPSGEAAIKSMLDPMELMSNLATDDDQELAGREKDMADDFELLAQGEAYLQSDKIQQMQGLYKSVTQNDASYPQALVLKGHDHFRKRELRAAMDAYLKALKLDPDLRYSRALAANVVGALGYQSKMAKELIMAHHTPTMIRYLAARSGEPGPIGRGHAVDLLEKLGRPQDIQHFVHGRLAVEEATSCEGRLDGVRSLARSGDKRAIPILEDLTSGLKGWFENSCLSDEADTALSKLRGTAS